MDARLAITLGDPAGIGGELALMLLRDRPDLPATLFGSSGQMAAAAEALGLTGPLPFRVLPAEAVNAPEAYTGGPVLLDLVELTPEQRRPGIPTPAGGTAQVRFLTAAIEAAKAGRVAALVTGPVGKAAVSSVIGSRFTGQTELLARLAGLRSGDVCMAFTGDGLRTALVTTHIALHDVPKALTAERIERVVRLEVTHLEDLGFDRPHLAVAALNPHAGEGGLFGNEEHDVIGPAIGAIQARFKEEKLRAVVFGPVPADSAFRKHVAGTYDAVIAMYHDQALIPCKLRPFGDTVNVTLGLPFVRTSVDHGTAYDIAGTGKADPRGLVAAWRLAQRLVWARAALKRTATGTILAP